MGNKENIKPRNANGEPHGDWIEYYSDGQLWYKGSFINGKQHGDLIRYYSSRQLSYKGEYINGKRVGMWKEWNWNTKDMIMYFMGNIKLI